MILHKFTVLLGITIGVFAPTISAWNPPVTPNAQEGCHRVLNYLYEISGKKMLGGITKQHEWEKMKGLIGGKTPGLFADEFHWSTRLYSGYRDGIVEHFKQRWHEDGIPVMLSHHICPPMPQFEGGDCNFNDINQVRSEEFFNEALTEGTETNRIMIKLVDEVVPYLTQLRDAGVPVMWRPFHEHNGNFFWWAQQPRYPDLWRWMFDRFVNHYELNNLLWVHNINYWDPGWGHAAQWEADQYYPGHDYVDILSVDIYEAWDHFYTGYIHDYLLDLGEGRPIGIGECGKLPTLDFITGEGSHYTFIAPWDASGWLDSPDEYVYEMYNHDHVLTADEFSIPEYDATPISAAQSPPSAALGNELHRFSISDRKIYIGAGSGGTVELVTLQGKTHVFSRIGPDGFVHLPLMASGIYCLNIRSGDLSESHTIMIP